MSGNGKLSYCVAAYLNECERWEISPVEKWSYNDNGIIRYSKYLATTRMDIRKTFPGDTQTSNHENMEFLYLDEDDVKDFKVCRGTMAVIKYLESEQNAKVA